jgi:hypothetical protein
MGAVAPMVTKALESYRDIHGRGVCLLCSHLRALKDKPGRPCVGQSFAEAFTSPFHAACGRTLVE